MAKQFASRVSKKERTKKDIAAHLGDDFFRFNDEKLLKGARLDDIDLSKVVVRKQVRTKFNEDSIAELAENIKENGLIQPLVVHSEGNKFVLICGERRFRALTTGTDLKMAPCFILENKTEQELMAIQFSENSAREQLHYIDQADSIYGYKKLTGASERKIQSALGISKSEVHRCILIAKVLKKVKEAAKIHNTEKYVLLEWNALEKGKLKEDLKKKIIDGSITKRLQLKRAINAVGIVKKPAEKATPKKSTKKKTKDDAAALIMKAMQSDPKNLNKTEQKLLKQFMKDAQNLIDS